jgi:septal ring factor EnvC (AmiA/AmiB activator)
MNDYDKDYKPESTPEPQSLGFLPQIATVAANPAVVFFLQYWKLIVFALLLLFSGYQHMRINSLKQDVTLIEEQNKTLKADYGVCQQKVADQSTKIIELSESSAKLNKQLEDLAPILVKIRNNTTKTVNEIMRDNVPKTCEELSEYILIHQKDSGWKVQK